MANEQATYSQQNYVISANGNSGDLFVGDATALDFDVDVTAIDAAATLTFFVERKGADGGYEHAPQGGAGGRGAAGAGEREGLSG